MKKKKTLQSHGKNSKVYIPILIDIFRRKYSENLEYIEFTLDEIRETAETLKIKVRNPPDLAYRMRSRTILPEEITDKGFNIIRSVKRGTYRLEIGKSPIVEIPKTKIIETIDSTPLPVRRLLPEDISTIDEQGLLTIVHYCGLLSHFTGLQVFRYKNHIRKGGTEAGQTEIDEIDVGVAIDINEKPIIFPIEAKAVEDPINSIQIASQVSFSKQFFKSHIIRPIAIKVDYDSLIHILEFNDSDKSQSLEIIDSKSYKLELSENQLEMIRKSFKSNA